MRHIPCAVSWNAQLADKSFNSWGHNSNSYKRTLWSWTTTFYLSTREGGAFKQSRSSAGGEAAYGLEKAASDLCVCGLYVWDLRTGCLVFPSIIPVTKRVSPWIWNASLLAKLSCQLALVNLCICPSGKLTDPQGSGYRHVQPSQVCMRYWGA